MYKKIIIILGLAVTLAGCGSKSVEQLYSEGVQQLQKANPGGAIVFFKNALEKDQNHLDARIQLAKAYVATGKHEQAEKEFQKVLRQNPSRDEIRLELARIHCTLKQPDLAIKGLGEYLNKHADSPEAYEILGVAYFAAKNPENAERSLLQALKIEPDRISAKLELASIYGAERKNREASDLLNGVIAKDPKNSRAYGMLAALEVATGNRDKALLIYSQMIQINPADVFAMYKSGLIQIEKGEMDQAEKIADEIAAKFPKRPESYRLKGIASYHRKNFANAVTQLQQSNKLQPTFEGFYYLGLSLYNQGQLENALSQFRMILDINPDFLQARLLTGMILLSQKRLDDSIVEINRVLQSDDKIALAHNLLGSAYMAKGQYDEGLKELNRATELDPKFVDAHIKKGLFHLSKGNAKDAEIDLRTAIKVSPELLNTRLILFTHYLRRHETTKAFSLLQEGLNGSKGDAILYNSMAAVMLAENRGAEAAKFLQKAKVSDPTFFAPYFNLAIIHSAAGDYDKSLLEYDAVLRKDPKNLKALLSTAALMELKQNEGDALTWYSRAKETQSPAAYIAMANFHARKKNPGKAISVLDEAIKTIPRNTSALELKGRLCVTEKKFKEAIKAFDDLEAITPDRGIPLKVSVYVAMKDIPKALEQARRCVSLKPNSVNGYLLLASIYESQQDFGRAEEELKNGLNKDKDNLQAMVTLGSLYTRGKEYNLASATLNEVVKKNRDFAPAYFLQGVLLETIGKKREAVGKYRLALAKSENYVAALNNLAYLSAEGYLNKQEGLRLAIAAFKLEPGNGGVLDTLGYILLKNGRKEEARKALEKAAIMLPDNPSVNFHLALACRETGDKERAAVILRKALQLGNFPEQHEAKTLLAALK